MNELVRDELIRIVRENGEDVLLDPVRTKAFLNDFCGNKYRREINSITLALKEGAVTELLNSRRNRTERFAIARLSKNLEESFGFPRQQTIWTVESIAIALGIISEKEATGVGKAQVERKPAETETGTTYRQDNRESKIKTSNGYELIYIEGGSFIMGDTWGDEYSDEKPTHRVKLTYDFCVGEYPVTFDEYDRYCRETGTEKPYDSGWGRERRPVINVSWFNAIEYCNWLSEKEGLSKVYDNKGTLLGKDGRVTTDPSKVAGYRLPTEAEWEYAARGGNKSKGYKYAGSDTVSDVAWYYENSGDKTQEVGKKAPNELGLYDMSGNVWEWCSDLYGSYSSPAQINRYNTSGSGRVLRGGSWVSSTADTRVASRSADSPTYTGYDLGFRICRTVP